MTRQQHKPQREPRTLAQQLGGAQIDCMICEQSKPAAGSRPFHAWTVCADCCADVEKRINKREAA